MFDPRVETMAQSELKALQLTRLQKTVARCYNNSSFYKKKMDEARVKPEDIRTLDDLRRLPFTNKTDLRDNYPFGMFSAPMEEIVRVHASSGTTGKPTTVGYTKNDIEAWSGCTARALACAGAGKNDVVQVSYGYGLFTGGLGLHYGVERLGATVLPISSGNTQRQIMLMQDFGTSIVACTPSYALMLGETMRDMGVDRSKLRLKAGVFGAEPWTEGMRKQIEELMGIDALDIYGLSETMGPGVAIECREEKHGLHIWEDQFIVEILDPETCEPLPDGEVGELVITTINKEGIPTLRYRTHDLTCIIPEPCSCGRTHRRIARLKGRTDDMLIVRGVNVFPSQVETVLTRVDGVVPHYLIVVDRKNNSDTMEVQVELHPDAVSDTVKNIESIRATLSKELQSYLGISAKVRLLPPKELERSEGKAKRVIDKRKFDN
ncbi:MAG: phenylacetate--CoA ligase family protein [Christensenellales bacterium]